MKPVDHSLKEATMQFETVTEQIFGCAYRIYNKMGFGFLESVYEKCMEIELNNAGLAVKSQEPIKVFMKEKLLGNLWPIWSWTTP